MNGLVKDQGRHLCSEKIIEDVDSEFIIREAGSVHRS